MEFCYGDICDSLRVRILQELVKIGGAIMIVQVFEDSKLVARRSRCAINNAVLNYYEECQCDWVLLVTLSDDQPLIQSAVMKLLQVVEFTKGISSAAFK